MSSKPETETKLSANPAIAWLKETLAKPNDSTSKTLLVAVVMCLGCSVAVSAAAVLLKPIQNNNALLDRKLNILDVAGLLEEGRDPDDIFAERIDPRVVDLSTGEYVADLDPTVYDQREAVRDPEMSEAIPPDKDLAKIGRKPLYANVYLVRDGDTIDKVILPIQGYGLWSQMHAFLALEEDLNTIAGMKFYEQGETPGLGGEVTNDDWAAQWSGKYAYDDNGKVMIQVIKGNVSGSDPEAEYKVDGLAGATLTSRGVTAMLKYWLSDEGYKPYLAQLQSERG